MWGGQVLIQHLHRHSNCVTKGILKCVCRVDEADATLAQVHTLCYKGRFEMWLQSAQVWCNIIYRYSNCVTQEVLKCVCRVDESDTYPHVQKLCYKGRFKMCVQSARVSYNIYTCTAIVTKGGLKCVCRVHKSDATLYTGIALFDSERFHICLQGGQVWYKIYSGTRFATAGDLKCACGVDKAVSSSLQALN